MVSHQRQAWHAEELVDEDSAARRSIYAKTNKQDFSFIKIADHGYFLLSICHPYLIPCTFIPQHNSAHPKLVVSRTCLIPKSECVKFLGTFVPQHTSAHPKLVGYLNPPTNLQYSYFHADGGS